MFGYIGNPSPYNDLIVSECRQAVGYIMGPHNPTAPKFAQHVFRVPAERGRMSVRRSQRPSQVSKVVNMPLRVNFFVVNLV